MNGNTSVARSILLYFGIILLAIGILGFIPGISSGYAGTGLLLGIFAINPLHNVIHILTGVVALAAVYYAGGAYVRWYGLVFGIVYAIVTLVGLFQIFFVDGQFLGVVPINGADNILHLAITVTTFAVYFLSSTREPAVSGV